MSQAGRDTRPVPLELKPDNIPDELKARRQWVGWRYEWVSSGWTKVPHKPDGRRVDITLSGSWSEFQPCLDALAKGKFDGIGYAISGDDPYTWIDLDHMLADNGTPSADALAAIELLDSYTEWSPSGEGFHVCVRGKLPPGGRKHGNYEAYDRDRYITVTGALVYPDDLTEINDRPDELCEFHAAYLTPDDSGPVIVLPRQMPARTDEDVTTRASEDPDYARLHAGDDSSFEGDQSAGDLVYCKILLRHTDDTDQVDRLVRLSKRYRPKWDRLFSRASGITYGARTIDQARLAVLREHTDDQSDPTTGPDGHPYTDLGNARRLYDTNPNTIRYVNDWGKWMIYVAGVWTIDHGRTKLRAMAHRVTIPLLQQIGPIRRDPKSMRAFMAWFHRAQSASGTNAAMTQAEGITELVVHHDELDQDPMLLNTTNGTLDLRSGYFKDHDPADLITMRTGCPYDPAARAPLWEAFLETFLPDPEIRSFVQRLASIGLVGESPKLLPILYGQGANGKTTLTEAVAAVLGDYATTADQDLLVVRKHEVHPTAKTDLFRKRFVHAGELRNSDRLNEAQVKQFTGGDVIKARRMFEDFWQFHPTHLLWLHSNYKPRIVGTDDAIWDRVLLIPFDVRLPEHLRVSSYHRVLFGQEGSGILNWLLAGYVEYRANGLQIPDAIRTATARYRAQSDTVSGFMDQHLSLQERLTIPARDMRRAHLEWHSENNIRTPEHSHFSQVTARLRELECTTYRSRQADGAIGVMWQGVGMCNGDQPQQLEITT